MEDIIKVIMRRDAGTRRRFIDVQPGRAQLPGHTGSDRHIQEHC